MAAISRSDFEAYAQKTLPDNTTGEISEADVRAVFGALANSALWHDESSTGPTGASAYEIAVASGFIGSEAEWLASLQGPVGPRGATGKTGPAGANGVNVAGVRAVAGTAYAVAAADEAQILLFSDSAGATITLPAEATAPMRIGASVHLMQKGGEIVFEAAAGVTVETDARAIARSAGPNAVVTAVKIGADRWYLAGGLEIRRTIPILQDAKAVAETPLSLDFRGEGVNVSTDAEGAVTVSVKTMDHGGALAGVSKVPATAYALTAADAGRLIEVESLAATTVTLPADADAALPVGAVVHIVQAGPETVTLAPGAGATIKQCATECLTLSGENAIATVVKTGANVWRAFGELSALRAFA